MQPPILRRLLVEDYQDAPSWFGRFIGVQNQFMEQTVLVLNKNVSFGDNIQARRFSTTFTTDANYLTGTFTNISFSWVSRELPLTTLIASIRHDDGTPFLGSVGAPTWTYINGNIVVSYIPGLAAGTKYNVTFLTF